MLVKMNRQLNQVDASPGGGAAPAQEPTEPTNATPAQGNVTDELMAKFEAKLETWRNGVFATVRQMVDKKATPGKDPKRSEPKGDEPTIAMQQDPAEVFMRLRSLDRAVMATGTTLTERQLARIERDFKAESPDDVSSWVRSYLDDLGIQKPAPAAEKQPQPSSQDQVKPPVQPRTAIPASGGGSPPPPRADIEDLQIVGGMSPADVDAYIKRHGIEKYNQQLLKQMRGTRIKTR